MYFAGAQCVVCTGVVLYGGAEPAGFGWVGGWVDMRANKSLHLQNGPLIFCSPIKISFFPGGKFFGFGWGGGWFGFGGWVRQTPPPLPRISTSLCAHDAVQRAVCKTPTQTHTLGPKMQTQPPGPVAICALRVKSPHDVRPIHHVFLGGFDRGQLHLGRTNSTRKLSHPRYPPPLPPPSSNPTIRQPEKWGAEGAGETFLMTSLAPGHPFARSRFDANGVVWCWFTVGYTSMSMA